MGRLPSKKTIREIQQKLREKLKNIEYTTASQDRTKEGFHCVIVECRTPIAKILNPRLQNNKDNRRLFGEILERAIFHAFALDNDEDDENH